MAAPLLAGLAKLAPQLAKHAPQLAKGAQAFQKYGQAAQAASEVIGELGDNLSNLGKQIDKTAFKIIHFADSIGKRWVDLQDVAFKTARTMAMSREQAERYNEQLIKSTKELAAQYGVSYKELAKFQEGYSQAIGRNVVLTREQLAHMSALSKITDNVTAEKLVDEFDKLGMSVETTLVHIGHMQEKAKAFGINATKFSKTLASNIKLATSYSFKNGLTDIEKMTMQSISLRSNMESIMRSTEKFNDIQGTIETSAQLQMLGGSSALFASNPAGLMYNAWADPAQYQEDIAKLAKSFITYDKKTGQTSLDPVKAQFAKYTAERLGMNKDEFVQIGMAGVQGDAVVKQLGAKAKNFSPEDLDALKNLSRGNFDQKTGKYQITWTDANGEHTKNVEDMTKDELRIARESQATEENMMIDVKDIKTILERVHGRARETKSVKETEEGLQNWYDAFVTGLQNIYMPVISDAYNKVSQWFGKRYENGGVVEPIHADSGTIVPGDSYSGDKVPAMVNSGEMILNKNQQKSMFSLISSLALTGGATYGVNKLGGKFGVKGLGSTFLLANMLGGGETDMVSLVEAHFIKRAITSMKPLKQLTSSIGTAAESSIKSNISLGNNWSELTKLMARDWNSLTKYMSSTFKKGLTSIGNFFTTGKIGNIVNGAGNVITTTGGYVSGKAKAVKTKAVSKWDAFKNSRKVQKIGHFYRNRVADAQMIKATSLDWLDKHTKGIQKVIGKAETKLIHARLGYDKIVKPKVSEYKNAFRNLFNDGSKAQASKAASRVGKFGTPEIAMTGRHTGINPAATASKAADVVSKGGKFAKYGGTLLKGAGKIAKPLGIALAAASTISNISAASSQYDAQADEIENSGMTERQKARAKDRATKQKNANIGSSVGSTAGMAAGTIAGAAIGQALIPIPFLGAAIGGIAGGWLGEKVGGFLGKSVGGMFGGSEEEKLLKEKEEEKERAKALVGDNKEVIKILKSIDGKMPGPSLASISPISKIASTIGIKPITAEDFIPKPIKAMGEFLHVSAGKAVDAITGTRSNDINLNIKGTIKLEGGNKSTDLDLSKLLDTPEFKRQLANIISKRLNEESNAGKTRNETKYSNTANIYNKTT